MRLLRFNTAQRVTVGPFLDETDGITPQTGLTVTSEKLTFVVDEGQVPTLILDVAPTASGGANDMVHITNDDSGYYDLELAAADVNHLGRASLSLNNVAAHCPVFHEFMIVPQAVYDAVVLGTGGLPSNLTQYLGTAVPVHAGPTGVVIGTAQNGSVSSLTLAAGTTVIQGAAGNIILATGGTGAGQTAVIAAPGMDNGTKIAPFVTDVVTAFDGTTTYVIFPAPPTPSVDDIQSGLATASALTSLQNDVTVLVGADRVYVKNTAVTAFAFFMRNTDLTPGAGKTVTAKIGKDGGALAAVAGAVTEVSDGWYKVDYTNTEFNADEIALNFTATGCLTTAVKIRTQS